MRRGFAAFGALLVFAGLAWAAVTPQDIAREHAALTAALAKSEDLDPDYAALAAALKPVIGDPAFAELPGGERYGGYAAYARALVEIRDYATARGVIVLMLAMPELDGTAWELRFRVSYRMHDYPDAAAALTALARRWPDVLAQFNDEAILNTPGESGKYPASAQVTADLLDALFAIHWRPQNRYWNADELWRPLAAIRLERGDLAGARAAALALVSPRSFVILHADKRFDPIVQADPDRFDVLAHWRVLLAYERRQAAATPDQLEGVNAVAEVLLITGRARAALKVVSRALARYRATPAAFSDADKQLNYTQDLRADALFRLGRSRDALAALAAGVAHQSGDGRVIEAINLAGAYMQNGRPRDALAALERLDAGNLMPYGKMAVAAIRACAYSRLDDMVALQPPLTYLMAHVADGASRYRYASLCLGDADAVAAQIIAELGDPLRRTEMLYQLQDFAPPPRLSPQQKALAETWRRVRARPDVAAAIARVGRIGTYTLAELPF